MTPGEVSEKLLKMDDFDFMTGVHFHDNLGLSFANSLSAIKCNVDIVDSTISGMGRGVGNLKTEQIVTYLNLRENNNNFSIKHILDIVYKFNKIKEDHGWGWDIDYMASGCLNIHQKNVISLREKNLKIHDIIESIVKE